MNNHLSKICVNSTDTIEIVLKRMGENNPGETRLPAGIVLVVDHNKKVLGIVTNGDLRRGLTHDMTLTDSVEKVMNKTPFLIEGPLSDIEMLSRAMEKMRKEGWHADHLNKIIVVDKKGIALDLVSLYDIWQRSDTRFKHIGVIGLGYVGLTLALTLADLGFHVRGLDTNPEVERLLKKKKAHFFETGLDRLLEDHCGKRFSVADNFIGENNCDVYFITVGTPLGKNNKPSLAYLENATQSVGSVLKYGDQVILRSTVPMGTTRNVVIPILEKKSGLRAGEGFFVSFAPERTIEGKALEELRHLPQVVGGINRASADNATNIFSVMTHSVITVESLEEAEMVKLVNNTYRDVTFAFANEVSFIAKRWGVDTHRVIDAANYGYERSRVPKPSPGVGGYCLEKDPYIFIDSARRKGYTPKLFECAREVSSAMINYVVSEIESFLKKENKSNKKAKIVVFGFAFKGRPVTSDVRGSSTIKIIKSLQKKRYYNLHGFDPAVAKNDITRFGVFYVQDITKGIKNADAVIIMNNNPYFEEIDMRNLLSRAQKSVLLLDAWGVYNKEEIKKVNSVTHKTL